MANNAYQVTLIDTPPIFCGIDHQPCGWAADIKVSGVKGVGGTGVLYDGGSRYWWAPIEADGTVSIRPGIVIPTGTQCSVWAVKKFFQRETPAGNVVTFSAP